MNNSQDLIRSVCRTYSPEEQLGLMLSDFEQDIFEIESNGTIFTKYELEKFDSVSLARIFASIKPLLHSTRNSIFNTDVSISDAEASPEVRLMQSELLTTQLKTILKFSILCRVSSDIIYILANRGALS